MPLVPVIESRRAYRALSTKNISRDVINRLIEAAHTAPSSGNNQPWRIITVDDDTQLAALKETLSRGNYWAQKAPVIAAFVTHPSWSMQIGDRDYAFFELGMAAMLFQLQAVHEGLYVHPIAGFNADAAKKVLGVPEEFVLETLVILGHPGEMDDLNEKHRESEIGPRLRKPIEDIATFSRWDERLVPKDK